MTEAARPAVRARFRIGPWVPGALLPIALGVTGLAASFLMLQDALIAVGVVLTVVSAVRVRSAAPWLLVAVLAAGQLQQDPTELGAELPAAVLAVHLIVVLTLGARVVPARARLQLAALGPAARALGLVQVVAQVLAAALLASTGRLQIVPVASTIGGALLVLVAGLLVVSRRAED